jgi:hypothetical protein
MRLQFPKSPQFSFQLAEKWVQLFPANRITLTMETQSCNEMIWKVPSKDWQEQILSLL